MIGVVTAPGDRRAAELLDIGRTCGARFDELVVYEGEQRLRTPGATAAAEQLGLSKQFVSRRLIQLEDRLGVRLLNRSTRRLDVTPLGQSYYESALRLLGEVEQVEQGIAGQNSEPRGTIRLSAPLSFAGVAGRPPTGSGLRGRTRPAR